MDEQISVIVPVYNVENYLSRCVESILAQTYTNLEIILVDDGAKDSSGAICDAFAGRDSRVRVIHKENGGLSSARNAGIDIAQGDYLQFVDSDDWIEADTCEQLLKTAKEFGVKLVCAGRYDVDSATGEKTIGLCPPAGEVISGKELVRRIFLWENADSSACDKLFHRSLFETTRFPLGVVCEDVPVMYRIVLEAGEAAMLNRPLYNYRHRRGSISASSISEKTFHFSQHTAVIYPFIRGNYPEIEKEARYFRIASLTHNLVMVEFAGEDDRRRFAGVYRDSQKEMRSHWWFVLTAPYFRRQERIVDLLLILGWYQGFRKLYHLLKG